MFFFNFTPIYFWMLRSWGKSIDLIWVAAPKDSDKPLYTVFLDIKNYMYLHFYVTHNCQNNSDYFSITTYTDHTLWRRFSVFLCGRKLDFRYGNFQFLRAWPKSHLEGCGSFLGLSMWDLCWINWHQNRLFSEYLKHVTNIARMHHNDLLKITIFRTSRRILGTFCQIDAVLKNESLRISRYRGIVFRMLQKTLLSLREFSS